MEFLWTGNRKQPNLQSLLRIVLAAEEILLKKLAPLQAAKAKAAAVLVEKSLIKEFVPVSENFVEIPKVSISGTETWTPESEVFVSGRKVEIPAFLISDILVTRAEYKSVIGSDPSTAKAYDKDGKELTGDAAGNNPVGYVGWCNAVIYCNRRSIKEGLTPCYSLNGSTDPDTWPAVPENADDEVNITWAEVICDFTANGYRLPTEAEWEWAARGGENFTYAGSDDKNEVALNYSGGTYEVKAKKANGYGLYDMCGNIDEFCWLILIARHLAQVRNRILIFGFDVYEVETLHIEIFLVRIIIFGLRVSVLFAQ